MKKSWLTILVVVLGAIFLSTFTISQTERGLVTVLGKLLQDKDGKAKMYEPGLNVKFPIISQVIRLDSRIQTLDIQESRIVTIEKKDVLVNSFVKWRIRDFAQFYKSTSGLFARAEDLLEQKVSDGLRAQFGRSTISQVVSENRDTIMRDLSTQINDSAESLGIEVVDVRIKRIDLPDEVSSSVFERMRAEREQVAAAHRADGERRAEEIRAKADEEARIIVARAQGEASVTRGEAEGKVTEIYGRAYSKDPDFYAFTRSLAAYETAFRNGKAEDIFVLSPEGEFFQFFGKTSQ